MTMLVTVRPVVHERREAWRLTLRRLRRAGHVSRKRRPISVRVSRPTLPRTLGGSGCLVGRDLAIMSSLFERPSGPVGGLADERVEPGQGLLVLGRRGRWQHRGGFVVGDHKGLDLDQLAVMHGRRPAY